MNSNGFSYDENGKCEFTGFWGGGDGGNGQLGVYTGYGNNFPHLAYYLSMGLATGDSMTTVPNLGGIKNLKSALRLPSSDRKIIFDSIRANINADERLRETTHMGNEIMQKLIV